MNEVGCLAQVTGYRGQPFAEYYYFNVILFNQGNTLGGSKITNILTEFCLLVHPTLSARHQ